MWKQNRAGSYAFLKHTARCFFALCENTQGRRYEKFCGQRRKKWDLVALFGATNGEITAYLETAGGAAAAQNDVRRNRMHYIQEFHWGLLSALWRRDGKEVIA